MRLIAQKPCSFGGKKFYVGDEIPAELVISPKTQAKLGVLTIYNDGGVGPKAEVKEAIMPLKPFENETDVTIFIEAESGSQALSAAPESISEALRIMQMDVKDAERVIDNVEDENVLIILHACDSRKGIKSASEKRAVSMHPDKEMEEFEETEEQLNLDDLEESVGDA